MHEDCINGKFKISNGKNMWDLTMATICSAHCLLSISVTSTDAQMKKPIGTGSLSLPLLLMLYKYQSNSYLMSDDFDS